jgi:hypothetical protein
MRRRHTAAAMAALFIALLGAGNALAEGPTPSPGRADWVERGQSRTFDLADGARVHVLRTRNDHSRRTAPSGAAGAALPGYGIDYHGGPVVPAENVFSIYWASSTIYANGPTPGTTGSGSADGSLVGYFLNHLGGSPYYNINTTYADTVGSGHTVANSLAYSGYWADNAGAPSGSQTVSDAAIQSEILAGFSSGKVAYDPATVYAVFSSGSVNLGGKFLTSYCAYHGSFSSSYGTVLYAVMPYNNAGPGTCTALLAPNGDAAADAEVNTLAHELEEANTDPQLNAWWNSGSGAENADQCAWNFGAQGLSGGQANITVGTKNFLVQQNWLNVSPGSCAQSYSAATANDFSISRNPASLSLAQNAQGTAAITTAVTSGTAQTVNLTVNGAPSGATATVSPTSVIAGGGSTLTVNAGTAAPGTYTLTITGTGTSATHSATLSLTVSGPSARPGAPSLTATTSSRSGVQLRWTVPANNGSAITAYRIYRSTSSGAETFLVQRGASSTSWRDTGTTPGTIYFYRISAVNGNGEGPLSLEASARAR